jgi:hypothetical protein
MRVSVKMKQITKLLLSPFPAPWELLEIPFLLSTYMNTAFLVPSLLHLTLCHLVQQYSKK